MNKREVYIEKDAVNNEIRFFIIEDELNENGKVENSVSYHLDHSGHVDVKKKESCSRTEPFFVLPYRLGLNIIEAIVKEFGNIAPSPSIVEMESLIQKNDNDKVITDLIQILKNVTSK